MNVRSQHRPNDAQPRIEQTETDTKPATTTTKMLIFLLIFYFIIFFFIAVVAFSTSLHHSFVRSASIFFVQFNSMTFGTFLLLIFVPLRAHQMNYFALNLLFLFRRRVNKKKKTFFSFLLTNCTSKSITENFEASNVGKNKIRGDEKEKWQIMNLNRSIIISFFWFGVFR